MEGKHLIFYDGTCGFCHKTIQFVLRHDTKKIFLFAPLQGETAKKYVGNFTDLDTVVLVENFETDKEIYTYGKGGFRIMWLLGGLWAVPGSISFLPSFLYDWGYRAVARHRYEWVEKESCLIPTKEDQTRFLH